MFAPFGVRCKVAQSKSKTDLSPETGLGASGTFGPRLTVHAHGARDLFLEGLAVVRDGCTGECTRSRSRAVPETKAVLLWLEPNYGSGSMTNGTHVWKAIHTMSDGL